ALEVQAEKDYYSLVRDFNNNRDLVKASYTVTHRPVDKKENYIKRCMAMPGDKLQIVQGEVMLNDKPAKVFPHAKTTYEVQTKGYGLSNDFLAENHIEVLGSNGVTYYLNAANNQVALLKQQPQVESIAPYTFPAQFTGDWAFPQDTTNYKWN